VLTKMLARHRGSQIFVFGSTGKPYWAARSPVEPGELELLDTALDRIEEVEAHRPKPYLSHDAERRLLVAALDGKEDLYVAVLQSGRDPQASAARANLLRKDLAPYMEPLREEIRRAREASG
jgi:hypothetical protein